MNTDEHRFGISNLRILICVQLCSSVALLCICFKPAHAAPDMILPDNLKTLGCAAPDTRYVMAASSQPGNVFYPGDSVDLTIKLAPEQKPKSLTLEITEIATRQNKHLKGESARREYALGRREVQSLAL